MSVTRLAPSTEASSTRWVILSILFGFSFVSYMERMNISIAAGYMKPELGLTDIQMGQIFSSFLLGYSIFQVPAGILGDRKGPRWVLTAAAFSWGLITLLTGLIPGLAIRTASGVFISLIVLRFLLGVGEAATYPVAARAIANWMPVSRRAFANAVVVGGLSLGSAATPPLISWLMVKLGWRESFYVTGLLAFFVAIVWRWYATDHPSSHRRVNEVELSHIVQDHIVSSGVAAGAVRKSADSSWITLLKNRNLCLLSVSYFFGGYGMYVFVFWLYLYLVEVRGFSAISGGIFTSIPFIVSSLLTPAGGAVSDSLSIRFGRHKARRITAATGLSTSSIFLLAGATAQNPYLAIMALSLSVGLIESAEGPFWASATDAAGEHAGAACGMLNTMGNLGGVVSTALSPVLVHHFGWVFAFGVTGSLTLTGGLIWLFIQPSGPSPSLSNRTAIEGA